MQTYYDDYSWVAGSGTTLPSTMATGYLSTSSDFVTSLNTSPTYAVGDTAFIITRGTVTGVRKIVLGTSQNLYDVTLYNDRSRVIQAQSVNSTGAIDTVDAQYNFVGMPLRRLTKHKKSSLGSINSIDHINYRFIGTMIGSDGKPVYDYTNKNWNKEPDYIKDLYPKP
jgi:hypothetical protein